MVSTIYETKPETGIDQPVQVIRDNFARAKLEIEDLQNSKVSKNGDVMLGVFRLLTTTTAALPSASANPAGILYNSTTGSVSFSDGTSWIDVAGAGDLVSTNNLSDVASSQSAINNLTQTNTVTVDVLRLADHSGNTLRWTVEEDSDTLTNSMIFDYNSIERIRITPTGDINLTGGITLDGSIEAVGSETNIDIALVPKGTGNVTISGLAYPNADGTNGQVLTTDGAGNLTFQTSGGGGGLADVVDDTSPQLGGDLDTNGFEITTVSNADVVLNPNGTGTIEFGGVYYSKRQDDVLTASATDEVLLSYTAFGHEATFIDYVLRRDVGAKIGTLRVFNDGSTASLFDSGNDISSPSVTFSAAINGANVEVKYTTSADSAASISYSIRQWFVDDYPPF